MLLALVAHAAVAQDVYLDGNEPLTPPPVELSGAFDGPPVPYWSADLPGRPLNASTHTERGSPVVAGDYVLVGAAGGHGLYELWRNNGGLVRVLEASGSVESTARVQDDLVYFGDTGGIVWCYGVDGELKWKRATGAPILVQPTVDRGRVYVSNVDGLAVALDATSGDLVWQYHRKPDPSREAELALYASPPALALGDSVLFGFSDGALVAVDRERGDVSWEKRVGEGRYPDLVAGPVAWKTDVFASGYFKPVVAVDLATHNVRWRLDYGSAAAPAVDERAGVAMLYHPGTDGKLRAIAVLTGAERWTWDSGTTGALTTPVITPAGLLIGSSEGSLYLIDPDTGRTAWKYDAESELDGVTTAPTVAGRQLFFVTNAGRLYSMVAPAHPALESPRWPNAGPVHAY